MGLKVAVPAPSGVKWSSVELVSDRSVKVREVWADLTPHLIPVG